MKTVAITGCIASGKSFVAFILEKLDYSVFYCDKFVSDLYLNEDFINQIKIKFPDINPINKPNIAKYIFNDNKAKQELESIIHPLVRGAIKKFFIDCKSNGKKICFVEIPLLFETGSESIFDFIITVTSSDELREKRALQREGMTLEKLKQILSTQMPDSSKIALSDFVLQTDCNELDLKEKIQNIINTINKHA